MSLKVMITGGGALGKRIGSAGLEKYSVTEDKIHDESVTFNKIAFTIKRDKGTFQKNKDNIFFIENIDQEDMYLPTGIYLPYIYVRKNTSQGGESNLIPQIVFKYVDQPASNQTNRSVWLKVISDDPWEETVDFDYVVHILHGQIAYSD